MPYQPTFPYPYMETIDPKQSHIFRCLINPRDKIYGYELTITPIKNKALEYIPNTAEVIVIKSSCENDAEAKKYVQTKTINGAACNVSMYDTVLPFSPVDDDSYLTVDINDNNGSNKLIAGVEYTWKIKATCNDGFASKDGNNVFVTNEPITATYYNEPQYEVVEIYNCGNPTDKKLGNRYYNYNNLANLGRKNLAGDTTRVSGEYYNNLNPLFDQKGYGNEWKNFSKEEKSRYFKNGYSHKNELNDTRTMNKINVFAVYQSVDSHQTWWRQTGYTYQRDVLHRASDIYGYIANYKTDKEYPEPYQKDGEITYDLLYIKKEGFKKYEESGDSLSSSNRLNRYRCAAIVDTEGTDTGESTSEDWIGFSGFEYNFLNDISNDDYMIKSNYCIAYSANDKPSDIVPGMCLMYKAGNSIIYDEIVDVVFMQLTNVVYIYLKNPIKELANGSTDKEFFVMSNYSESSQFYFKAMDEPSISIDLKDLHPITTPPEETIAGERPEIWQAHVNLTGHYSQSQNNQINWFKYNLYLDGYYPFDNSSTLIATSGEILSANMEYQFVGLINGKNYTVELIVEDENGIEVTCKEQFKCEYHETAGNIVTVEYSQTYGTMQIVINPEIIRKIYPNELLKEPLYYSVTRYEYDNGIKSSTLLPIVKSTELDTINDFNIQADKKYIYIVEFDFHNVYWKPVMTNPVMASPQELVMYDLIPTEKKNVFSVDLRNIFRFNTDLKISEFKVNTKKEYFETYKSKYPRKNISSSSYLTGSVESLLGTYGCNKKYAEGGITFIQKLREVVENDHLKLLVDKKGHCIICDINDLTYSYESEGDTLPTKVTFNFTEMMDASKVSIRNISRSLIMA